LLPILVVVGRQSCDEPGDDRRDEDCCGADGGAEQGADTAEQKEHEQADDLIPAEPCPQNDCGDRQTQNEVHGGAVSVHRHEPPGELVLCHCSVGPIRHIHRGSSGHRARHEGIGRGLSACLRDARDAVAIGLRLHSIGGQGRPGVDAPARPASETPPLGGFK
jgi:hypothetical protein